MTDAEALRRVLHGTGVEADLDCPAHGCPPYNTPPEAAPGLCPYCIGPKRCRVHDDPEAASGVITPGGNPVCPKCGRWYGPGEQHDCEAASGGVDGGLTDDEREALLRAHVHISPVSLFAAVECILAARAARAARVAAALEQAHAEACVRHTAMSTGRDVCLTHRCEWGECDL